MSLNDDDASRLWELEQAITALLETPMNHSGFHGSLERLWNARMRIWTSTGALGDAIKEKDREMAERATL